MPVVECEKWSLLYSLVSLGLNVFKSCKMLLKSINSFEGRYGIALIEICVNGFLTITFKHMLLGP